MAHQGVEIVSLSQSRKQKPKMVEPVKEVFAEHSLGHALFQVLPCDNQANVHGNLGAVPHRSHDTRLNNPEQLRLYFRGQRINFVQEKRAVIRLGKDPFSSR